MYLIYRVREKMPYQWLCPPLWGEGKLSNIIRIHAFVLFYRFWWLQSLVVLFGVLMSRKESEF